MATTIYSHAFLVGCFNGDIKPQDLNTYIWSRQILTAEEYSELLSDYYKSQVDSMVEAQNQTRPDILQSICHYSIDLDSSCKHPFRICLTKGRAETPYDYTLCLCKLHLYFFPHDIVLFTLEIDDSGVDLNLMTLGHGSLINLKFGETGNEELYQKMEPLLDLVDDNKIKHLVKDGNNMKIFQIVEVESKNPEDNMLFEIGTFIPLGAVGGTDDDSPSKKYFTQIINDNTVSVFYNWKALALVDSFTVLGVDGYNKWTWKNLYFPLIYLKCIYEKTFCFSRNSAYRLGKAVENLSKEITDMEKYYFYNNISYNFLPEMLYDFMVRGIGLKEEREEISKQIKETTKRDAEEKKNKEDKTRNLILAFVSVFAVFSIIWDLCQIVKDALSIDKDPTPARGFIGVAILLICILLFLIYRRKDNV